MEEKRNVQQDQEEDRWSGLMSQIANMARFSEPPMDIKIINILTTLLWLFNSAAIGWLSATLFVEGRTGYMYWVWLCAGYLLGGVVALVSFLNRMYGYMSRVKLTGKDYQHVESKSDKITSASYSTITLLAEIIACAMFTYAIVNISDAKVDRTKAVTKLEEINRVTTYKDSLFAEQRKYYMWLDDDGDKTNDDWARMRLDEIERDRKKERTQEDSLRNILSVVVADTSVQLANASTSTQLIKDLSLKEAPENSRYKLSLAALSALIGGMIVGGLVFLAKVKGRYKAYQNINKVLNEKENKKQEDKPYESSKFIRFIKRLNKDYHTPGSTPQGSGGGGGTAFNWKSETIQERLGYIRNHYHRYGGQETQKQIAATLEVGESYISQLIKAAQEANELPPFKY